MSYTVPCIITFYRGSESLDRSLDAGVHQLNGQKNQLEYTNPVGSVPNI